MSEHSAIEWTDATWNPVRGCVKVSPGCAHCYAETFAERFRGVAGHPYEQGFDLRLVPQKLTEPLRWQKPRRVFVNSMSDLFQDGVDYDFIVRVFGVMQQAYRHTFQVLTKRPARMLDIVGHPSFHSNVSGFAGVAPIPWPLPNVWLGVSVENQHFADERIPLLLQTPAAVRFISAEPLLEPVDVGTYLHRDYSECDSPETCDHWIRGCHNLKVREPLSWVIVGGESGPGARPFDVAWARSIVAQCQAAGVPVFVKQLGAKPIDSSRGILHCANEPHATKCNAVILHDRKGGDIDEWPADLRVREFPKDGGISH